MNTGPKQPEVIKVQHAGLIPTGHTYKPFKGKFEDCQREFQAKFPWYVPEKVYWIERLHEMWVEMAYGTEAQE